MKKLPKWLGTAVLLIAASALQAQPDNFYRFLGNYDHGIGREIIQSIDPANPGYVFTGTANIPSPNNQPGVMVSAIKTNGGMLWSRIYPLSNVNPGGNTVADGMSIAAAPVANIYGVVAYSDFTTPKQSVLFQINLNGTLTGIWTPLSDMRATSVIFDPGINCFVVLGQASTNGGDLQLIVVNLAGGIVFSQTYDSGPGFTDTPARLVLDFNTGYYTLVGTSDNGIDKDVFVVRVKSGSFGLVCSERIGTPGINESGVDVTPGKTLSGNPSEIILGNISGAVNMPFVIELDGNNCPGLLSATLVNPKTPNNLPTGIVTDGSNYTYSICGKNFDMNTNGFIAQLNQNFTPATYARYGQPGLPGDEDLTDILLDPANGMLVNTGEHQLLGSWPGFPTPPGEFFPWVVMTNTAAVGQCPDLPSLQTQPLCLTETVYNIEAPYLNNFPLNVAQFPIQNTMLNECTNPFRMDNSNHSATGAAVNIYPNPASKSVSLQYSVSETDQPVLEVTNMLGEIVLTQTLRGNENKADVDISSLSPGMYFFRIRNGDVELANEKVTIER